jgi:hypothetical protein
MAKKQDMFAIIRLYKEETGEKEIDMRDVAKFAADRGWPLPEPASPLDLLAKQFTNAAREEIRRDKATGRPYRANHAISTGQGDLFRHRWIDIDEAGRPQMLKSLMKRREQMVGDGLQLSLDLDHWHAINPNEEPIDIPMDFTLDIEWRKNTPDNDEEAA